MIAERQVEIDSMLERTGQGVFIPHRESPVGADLTRRDDRWYLVPWDSKDDEYGYPRSCFRSQSRRRAIETFTTLVNFWRADMRHPWWDGSQPVERPEPSHTSPMEREHFEA